MADIQPIKTNNFYGGIADDLRQIARESFGITKHFDIFSQPSRLIPYRSLEADTHDGSSSTGMKQYSVRDFVYASASAKLYGLGQTAGGLTKIVYKDDATVGNWTLPASSEGNGAVKNGCFFEYKDYLWAFQGTNQILKWGLLSGSPSITNSVATVGATITSVANGVIAADGNAYMAYNNVVVRIATDASTITDNAKTVPSNYKITSLENYGSYLAIGCSPASSFNGQSKVFLWNLSSDLFYETIDWGEGDLRVLGLVEGMLIGITDRYLNNSVGAGKGSLVIQGYSGGAAQILKEVYTQALTGKTIPLSKVVKNNRLFFAAKIMKDAAGTTYDEGIWSFGRKNPKYPFALTLDIIDENINTSGIQGFGSAANYFFIAHSADGSIDKTNDAATYAFSSVYESLIENFGDTNADKQLDFIKVNFRKLAAGETLTVKYRLDGATAWTTVGTHSTEGDLSHTFVNLEAASNAAFASGREFEFRLESTGGLEITGFEAQASVLNNI